ncbi:MAG: hypothetical protein JEZ05_06965 [Tenericutes bacterium]|nr:hypothetical protein [Mycoplasmatota bacterium]
MKWYEIVLLILAIAIVASMLLLWIKTLRYKTIIENIEKKIQGIYQNVSFTRFKANMTYQTEVKTDKLYLIKIIDMNPHHEVIITNSEKVVVNDDIKGWKRSSNVEFVAGMKEFMNLKSEKELVKIVLIYPNCHNITKYINESDAYRVEYNKKVDDLYFVKYTELEQFLKKH